MNEPARQMTRRDWFRLRPRQEKRDRLGSEEQAGMRKLEDPPNYDGMDMSELPPVHEALISNEDVSALLLDIKNCASDVQLIARSAKQSQSDQAVSLAALGQALLEGKAQKAQIRYRWQDSRWIDTLERQPQGFRLVRIRHLQ